MDVAFVRRRLKFKTLTNYLMVLCCYRGSKGREFLYDVLPHSPTKLTKPQ